MTRFRQAVFSLLVLAASVPLAARTAEYVETPYGEDQKVVFDFYLDDPQKMGAALFWIRSYLNPLTEAPYGYAPDFMSIKVVIHGTEIVTLAQKNYDRFEEVVERMRYYAAFGVEFRVCALAAEDYGYTREDFYDFVTVVPSAITELGHWQQQGHALIIPQVLTRTKSIEEIR
jgi:intracellular sulfur oxidation DsrE/DsrF family protein